MIITFFIIFFKTYFCYSIKVYATNNCNKNFQINLQSIVFKNISNNFLLTVHHFCEFKSFLNFIFYRPVWSKHQLQYIVLDSLKRFLETIYIVFLIIRLFDLQSNILFVVFIWRRKYVPNVSRSFSQKTYRKSLVLNSLHGLTYFGPNKHFNCCLLSASLSGWQF